jgi:hypothetical protein
MSDALNGFSDIPRNCPLGYHASAGYKYLTQVGENYVLHVIMIIANAFIRAAQIRPCDCSEGRRATSVAPWQDEYHGGKESQTQISSVIEVIIYTGVKHRAQFS